MSTARNPTQPSAQAVLDALTARICVVDEHGNMLAANAAWRRRESPPVPDAEYAERLAAGLREVLAGRRATVSLLYQSEEAPTRGWCLARVTRLAGGGPATAVVVHEDISEAEVEELTHRLQPRTSRTAAAGEEVEDLVHAVSHDLRAPLHAIEGFSHALLQSHAEALDPRGRHYLERIRAGALQMGRIVEGMLSLVRVSRAGLHVQTIDLAALARDVVGELRSQEPDREVRVEIAARLSARGDKDLLALALHDLLENAWKFTRPTAQAFIEVGQYEDERGHLVFFVRDNGVGFDMRYADKLFGTFQRLHSSSEFPGAGVGLARVHRIVTRHGGRVWAASHPGVATTLSFTLADAGV